MLENAEVDEPETMAVPTFPYAGRSVLEPDDLTTDMVTDVLTEEELLRGLARFLPVQSFVSGGPDTESLGGSPTRVPQMEEARSGENAQAGLQC